MRLVRLFEFGREVEGGNTLTLLGGDDSFAKITDFQKTKVNFPNRRSVITTGSGTSGSATYRCKDYETFQNEMRGEYDQEIHHRVLHDLVQDRRNCGLSQASVPTTCPDDDHECQEVL